MKRGGEPKKEDAFTVTAILIALPLMIGFLIWISASHKIVIFWTPKLYWLGKIWRWLPGEISTGEVEGMRATAERFWADPRAVHLGEWLMYVQVCAWPITWIICLAIIAWLIRTVMRKPPNVQRKFKPQDLAEKLSFVFTGTAPVLHLR